jgi:hypothetical protein
MALQNNARKVAPKEPMPVDEDEFKRIVGNLLKMPPKKHADSKLGKKKTTGKIIPPKKVDRAEKQGS